MAAGASVIQREVSLSALCISQPAVITSRPFSHRVQSAKLLVSQGQRFEVDRSFIARSNKFPDIEKLEITQFRRNDTLLYKDQQPTKGSAFPNFRLLQRLAASAKARVSCEPKDDHRNHASNLNFSQEGDNYQNYSLEATFESALSEDDVLSILPSSLNDLQRNVKVKKPHKQHLKQKTKKPVKQSQLSQGIGRDQPAALNNLQPNSSKVVPTFSKQFNRHRRTQTRKRNSSGQIECSSPCENGSYHFCTNLTAEGATIPEKSLTSNNLIAELGCRAGVSVSNNNTDFVQEASLRAIYDTSNNTPSVLSNPLKRVKLKKVFQSEKQSGSISHCGRLLPCAPPTSPTPLVLEKYEIIPSLADLRSQQSIKQRLTALVKDAKKKQTVEEKQKKKREMEVLQVQLETQRTRTRQEIYALNKIMTKLEKDHFKKFQERMKNR